MTVSRQPTHSAIAPVDGVSDAERLKEVMLVLAEPAVNYAQIRLEENAGTGTAQLYIL